MTDMMRVMLYISSVVYMENGSQYTYRYDVVVVVVVLGGAFVLASQCNIGVASLEATIHSNGTQLQN